MTDTPQPGTQRPEDWPPPAQPPTWQAPPPEPGPAPGLSFAPHGARLLAYIIDSVIVGLVYSAAAVIVALVVFAGTSLSGLRFGDVTPDEFTPAMVGPLIGLVTVLFILALVAWGYFPFFWWRGGQTPGMKLFDLYVVRDSDGGPVGGGQAILRLVGMWVAAVVVYIGFIWVFVDARRRGWHDLIAGTCVIERHR